MQYNLKFAPLINNRILHVNYTKMIEASPNII